MRGAFIGDELLFNKTGIYDYTIKVSSDKARFYRVDRNIFALRFPKQVFSAMRKNFEFRDDHN